MCAATGALPYPKRILCATDLTPFSRRALEYAIALARPAGAEITALHVLLLPLPSIDSDDEPDWMPPGPGSSSEVLERMRRFVAPADAASLPTRILLREGIPADEIRRAAAQLGTDLIVMGTHGRSGLPRLLGSHAERVLRRAPCPVLTVSFTEEGAPADTPVQIREVLCAASGSKSSPRTLEYAECLVEGTRAHLSLVCVANPLHPASDILDLAKNRRADLIVIGNHDRGYGVIGCLGSTSAQVIRDAECAVITMPCQKARVEHLAELQIK